MKEGRRNGKNGEGEVKYPALLSLAHGL